MSNKKKPGFRKWIILVLVLFGPGFLLFFLSKGKQKIHALPKMGQIGQFEFKTADGERINNESLAGNIVVFSTIQPTCPDTCGVHLNQMSELIYEWLYSNREKRKNVKIISIVTDPRGKPSNDTVTINYMLKRYVRDYDPQIWQPVYGDPKQLYDVVINGNNLYEEQSESSMGGKLFLNSLLLVDKSGAVRSLRIAKGEAQVRDLSGELRGLIGEYRHAED